MPRGVATIMTTQMGDEEVYTVGRWASRLSRLMNCTSVVVIDGETCIVLDGENVKYTWRLWGCF